MQQHDRRMQHDDCREALLRDEITPVVREHLQRCASCARLADEVAALKADLRNPPPAPRDLVERALERHAHEGISAADRPGNRFGRLVFLGARRPRRSGRRRRGALLVAALSGSAAIATLCVIAFVLGPAPGAAIATMPLSADCPDGPAGSGDARPGSAREPTVVVAGIWTGKEQERFKEVLERFQDRTGEKVMYAYKSRDIATKLPADLAKPLNARILDDCPPDVALLPQPGLLEDFARHGQLKALDATTAALVRKNYPPEWRQMASVDGKPYGVWLKAANKSTIWYSRRLFEKAGIERPPRTLDELEEVTAKLRTARIKPFAVAGKDGWTLTDWFENAYLRTAGPGAYGKLARGDVSWTDPTVREALLRLSDVLGRPGWLDDDVATAMNTTFEQSVAQVFARGEAAMVFEGDFVASNIGEDAQDDVGAFPFPTDGGADNGVVVGGDVAVQFTDNPAANKLMRFLATPEAAESWARAGGFISPNRKLDATTYEDPVMRRLAEAVIDAEAVRFDLSDLQPPAFGASRTQGMWPLFQRYLEEGPASITRVTSALQAGVDAARSCEENNSEGKVAAQC